METLSGSKKNRKADDRVVVKRKLIKKWKQWMAVSRKMEAVSGLELSERTMMSKQLPDREAEIVVDSIQTLIQNPKSRVNE